jgi:tetratricopeptide (TPR) repeat protein
MTAQSLGDYAGARTYYDQSLGIAREIGDRWGEGIRLLNLGWLFWQQGDYQTGQEYSQQALNMAQELGSQYLEGYALASLGHSRVGLGRLAESVHAYQQAFELWQAAGQQGKAMQALAGLAGVSHLQGDLSQAQAQVEEILSYLETNTLDDPDELFQVYLTCYHVLHANEDPRAREVLADAHRQLQELAARIPDAETRRSFLENVPVNREIVGLWRSQQGDG